MRYLFLGNGKLGADILEWLCRSGDPPVGVAIHPLSRLKEGKRFSSLTDEFNLHVVDGSMLDSDGIIDEVAELGADAGVSVMFGYLLKKPFLDLFPKGCVNLHTSFLPYNRGAHPNVWAIVDRTPAGATLHLIDSGIDTGPIIAQREVEVEPVDTGKTLYEKLEAAAFDLFMTSWPQFVAGELSPLPQPGDAGTSHRVRDLSILDEIELDRSCTARTVIDVLRARTFPPHRGSYFVHHGRRVYLKLELEYEDEEET